MVAVFSIEAPGEALTLTRNVMTAVSPDASDPVQWMPPVSVTVPMLAWAEPAT